MKSDYNRNNINLKDTAKYKKKSQNKPPAKSNHKHNYQDCIFEWDNPHGSFSKETGWAKQHEIFGGSYCTICGKIKYDMSFNWYNIVHENHGHAIRLSERAKQESNPKTRTLTTFFLKDGWNQKYITINGGNT